MDNLPPEVVKKAFDYMKVRKNDFIAILSNAGLKPGPEHAPPTTTDYVKWTIKEWAGFLYKYITPSKK
jgi:hypothetical protein